MTEVIGFNVRHILLDTLHDRIIWKTVLKCGSFFNLRVTSLILNGCDHGINQLVGVADELVESASGRGEILQEGFTRRVCNVDEGANDVVAGDDADIFSQGFLGVERVTIREGDNSLVIDLGVFDLIVRSFETFQHVSSTDCLNAVDGLFNGSLILDTCQGLIDDSSIRECDNRDKVLLV